MIKRIVWEKFKDPFDDIMEEEEDEDESIAELPKTAIFTSNGILPITENSLLSHKYNLWMADTNFDITNELVEFIEELPGIETLDIYTRYKFRVGVGKLFEENEVKILIEYVLGCMSSSIESLDPEVHEEIQGMIEGIEEGNAYAIYVFPNGKAISFVNTDRNQVIEKLQLFEEVQTKVGGHLFSSES